jgi:hypothetical protein
MSKSMIGARILYCGHVGWFVADIYKIGTANVVRANGPVTPENVVRDSLQSVTHELKDFPVAGFWRPDLGIFVVPSAQVVRIRNIPARAPLHDPGNERFDVGHLNDVRFGSQDD